MAVATFASRLAEQLAPALIDHKENELEEMLLATLRELPESALKAQLLQQSAHVVDLVTECVAACMSFFLSHVWALTWHRVLDE